MNRYEDYNPNIGDQLTNSDSDADILTYTDTDETQNDSRRKVSSSRSTKASRKKRVAKTDKRATNSGNSADGGGYKNLIVSIKTALASTQMRLLLGITCLLLCTYLLVAFISYLRDGWIDQSVVNHMPQGAAVVKNAAGEGGARLSEFLINDCFGLGSIVIVVWLAWMSMKQFGLMRFKAVNFSIKCLVALITTSLIVGLMTIAVDSRFHWGEIMGILSIKP